MACIKLCPFMGLSMYSVCRQGTSKPVSHISQTITSLSSSFGFFIRSANMRRCSLEVWCFEISGPSDEADVITTLIAPLLSSSECHSGLSFMIASYKSTAIRRLIVTIIPLPSKTVCRCSKCSIISLAI